MDIHEYQAKEILKKYGIPITEFAIVTSLKQAEEAINAMKLDKAVIKVQVHAGGRGKAGGVKLAKTRQEILDAVQKLLGMRIINNQTGKEGVVAHQLLITPLTDYRKEYYLGAVIDRKRAQAVIIASPEGGMDIEEVAEKHPDKILKLPISSDGTLRSYHYLELNKIMGWSGSLAEQGKKIVSGLAKAFIETDASLLEINPLVVTNDDRIVALDAKLSIDDNALFRQPEIKGFYDPTQSSASEVKAKEFDLAYIALDGEIGCMVNGAGLAMATMDIIKHYGGTPANFLDVGGGASQEKVAEGFKIILADPKVKAILVNIFGGIMNCATLAAGIISAAQQLQVKVPLVVRMEGTNVDEGKKLLAESGLNIIIAKDLSDAAKQVVQQSKGKR
jgi:succinyl-CoA synthetase beta subunit